MEISKIENTSTAFVDKYSPAVNLLKSFKRYCRKFTFLYDVRFMHAELWISFWEGFYQATWPPSLILPLFTVSKFQSFRYKLRNCCNLRKLSNKNVTSKEPVIFQLNTHIPPRLKPNTYSTLLKMLTFSSESWKRLRPTTPLHHIVKKQAS